METGHAMFAPQGVIVMDGGTHGRPVLETAGQYSIIESRGLRARPVVGVGAIMRRPPYSMRSSTTPVSQVGLPSPTAPLVAPLRRGVR